MKNTTATQSYDGEQIYVGIDMHKKTDVVVARVKQVITSIPGEQKNSPSARGTWINQR